MPKHPFNAYPDPFLMRLNEDAPEEFIDEVVDLMDNPGDLVQDRPTQPETVTESLPSLSKMIDSARRRLKRTWVPKAEIRKELPDHVTDEDFEKYWEERKQGNRYHRAYEFAHNGEQEIVAVGRRRGYGVERGAPAKDTRNVDDMLREFSDDDDLNIGEAAFHHPSMQSFLAGFEREVNDDLFTHPDDLLPESTASRAALLNDGGLSYNLLDESQDRPQLAPGKSWGNDLKIGDLEIGDDVTTVPSRRPQDAGMAPQRGVRGKLTKIARTNATLDTGYVDDLSVKKADLIGGYVMRGNKIHKITEDADDRYFEENPVVIGATPISRKSALDNPDDDPETAPILGTPPTYTGKQQATDDPFVTDVRKGDLLPMFPDKKTKGAWTIHYVHLASGKPEAKTFEVQGTKTEVEKVLREKFVRDRHIQQVEVEDPTGETKPVKLAFPHRLREDTIEEAKAPLAPNAAKTILTKVAADYQRYNPSFELLGKPDADPYGKPQIEALLDDDTNGRRLILVLKLKPDHVEAVVATGGEGDVLDKGGVVVWKQKYSADQVDQHAIKNDMVKASNFKVKWPTLRESRLLREGRNYKAHEWPAFFASMEGESMGYPYWRDPNDDGVTAQLKQAARAFAEEVKKATKEFFRKNKTALADGASEAKFDNDEWVSDVLLTLEGHGAGIWDGDWDHLFADGNEGVKKMQDFLEPKLTRAHGKIMDAIRDSAYETMGGDETDRLREDRLTESFGNVEPPAMSEEDWDSLDPKAQRAWKGYSVNMTYQVVTPESAEEGDFADSGFEFKDRKYKYLEELVDGVHDKSWIEWSSSHPQPGDWITSEGEPNYRDGSNTSYGLHIKRVDGKPLTKAEMQFLNDKLRLGGHLREDQLDEDLDMSDGDKKVLKAFLDKKSGSSKRFDSDGTTLDGLWMGGRDIAHWEGGKIHFREGVPTGRSEQTVIRFLMKNGAKFDFAPDIQKIYATWFPKRLREGLDEGPGAGVNFAFTRPTKFRGDKPDFDGDIRVDPKTFKITGKVKVQNLTMESYYDAQTARDAGTIGTIGFRNGEAEKELRAMQERFGKIKSMSLTIDTVENRMYSAGFIRAKLANYFDVQGDGTVEITYADGGGDTLNVYFNAVFNPSKECHKAYENLDAIEEGKLPPDVFEERKISSWLVFFKGGLLPSGNAPIRPEDKRKWREQLADELEKLGVKILRVRDNNNSINIYPNDVIKDEDDIRAITAKVKKPSPWEVTKIVKSYPANEDRPPRDVFEVAEAAPLVEGVLDAMCRTYLGFPLNEVQGKQPPKRTRDWLGWDEAQKNIEELKKKLESETEDEAVRQAIRKFDLPEGVWGSGTVVSTKMDPLLDRVLKAVSQKRWDKEKRSVLETLDGLLERVKKFAEQPELVKMEESALTDRRRRLEEAVGSTETARTHELRERLVRGRKSILDYLDE